MSMMGQLMKPKKTEITGEINVTVNVMWDVIVLIPDHCLSIYFIFTMALIAYWISLVDVL